MTDKGTTPTHATQPGTPGEASAGARRAVVEGDSGEAAGAQQAGDAASNEPPGDPVGGGGQKRRHLDCDLQIYVTIQSRSERLLKGPAPNRTALMGDECAAAPNDAA